MLQSDDARHEPVPAGQWSWQCRRCRTQWLSGRRPRRERCSMLAHVETGFVVHSIGGIVPLQAEGRTDTDHPFYFRSRHGRWTLEVGPAGAPTNYLEWPAGSEKLIGEGEDPDSPMSHEQAFDIMRKHFS